MPLKTIHIICLCFFSLPCNICFGQQPRLVLPVGHTKAVLALDFSMDSRLLISGSDDNTAKLWDVASGKELLSFVGHTDRVISVKFFNNDLHLITGSEDNTAKIWNCKTGKLVFDLKGHKDRITSVNLSPDEKLAITSSADNTAKIWNTETGQLLHTLVNHQWAVVKAIFSITGTKVITVSEDSKVIIWDVVTGRLLNQLTHHESGVLDVCTIAGTNLLITASADQTAAVIDIDSGKLIQQFSGHTNNVERVVAVKNGKFAFTTSFDSTVKCWNMETGKLVYTKSQGAQISDITISPDDKWMATAATNSLIRIWEVVSGREIQILTGHERGARTVAFSKNSEVLASGSNDNRIKLWNAGSAQLIKTIGTHTETVVYMQYSEDSAYYLTCANDDQKNSIRNKGKSLIMAIVETATGKEISRKIFSVDSISYEFNAIVYSRDGKYYITKDEKGNVSIHDAFSTKLVRIIKNNDNEILDADFFDSSGKIISIYHKNYIKVWDTKDSLKDELLVNGKSEIIRFKYFHKARELYYVTKQNELVNFNLRLKKIKSKMPLFPGGKITFFQNEEQAAVYTTAKKGIYIEGNSGMLQKHILKIKGEPEEPRLIQNGKSIMFFENREYARIYDIKTGRVKLAFKVWDQLGYIGFVNSSGDKFYHSQEDNSIAERNLINGKTERIFIKHQNWLIHISPYPFKNRIISHGWDNQSVIWDKEKALPVCFRLQLKGNNWINYLPTGYYYASAEASKLLYYVTKDLKIIDFDQLDVKYNRPDKVLEALGNRDTLLINSYRRAYQKRIKKLGIDTTAFRDGYSVPEADFPNRNKIEFEQKDGNLKLELKSVDSTYKLDRFNVWINETPLYGQRGISLRNKNKNSFDSTIMIDLSQGQNRIETSITNVNGTESYRMPLLVNYTPAVKQKEQTYFIGIGIDQFKESKYNLKYSTKDIRDLSTKLKKKYRDIIIDTLFNENVTISHVKALKQKLLQTSVNDKVIISYSGHGMLSKDFDYYLSTYAVNFDKPEENGLPYDEL
ncbi:MAG: WD40 repeat domain-containing protein, partial [Ferruginibacter sp.]